jgi:hypothetical protein
MSQINIQITPEFERRLKQYMCEHGIKRRAEAVRRALEESLGGKPRQSGKSGLRDLLGAANRYPQRPRYEWMRALYSLQSHPVGR